MNFSGIMSTLANLQICESVCQLLDVFHFRLTPSQVRTEAYRDAILKNPTLLCGSVVMDVGCGTGILR